MALLKSLGSELEKTARSSAKAVVGVPSAFFVDTLVMGRSPIPAMREMTGTAIKDLLTLPFRLAGTAAVETAKGTLSLAGKAARVAVRNIPVPVPR